MIPVNRIEIGAKVKFIRDGLKYIGHIVALDENTDYRKYKKNLPCRLLITLENFSGHDGYPKKYYHTDGREGTKEDIYSKEITQDSCWYVNSDDPNLHLESFTLPEKQFIENVQLRLKTRKVVKIREYLGFSELFNCYLVKADDGNSYAESDFEAYEVDTTLSIPETPINISPKNQPIAEEKETSTIFITGNGLNTFWKDAYPKHFKDYEFKSPIEDTFSEKECKVSVDVSPFLKKKAPILNTEN